MMRVRVLNLDDQPDSIGETFDPNGIEIPDEPVPVAVNCDFTEPRYALGWAKLIHVEGGIDAELSLHKTVVGYPTIVGRVQEGDREGKRIKKCKLTGVGICCFRNDDHRIDFIRYYAGEALVPTEKT